VPSGHKWIEAIIDEHYESAASPSNYHEAGENEVLYASTILYRWGKEKRRTYLHIYYNASKAVGERRPKQSEWQNADFGQTTTEGRIVMRTLIKK
jgi:hypothetical protein